MPKYAGQIKNELGNLISPPMMEATGFAGISKKHTAQGFSTNPWAGSYIQRHPCLEGVPEKHVIADHCSVKPVRRMVHGSGGGRFSSILCLMNTATYDTASLPNSRHLCIPELNKRANSSDLSVEHTKSFWCS
jgi:hypothetical protein